MTDVRVEDETEHIDLSRTDARGRFELLAALRRQLTVPPLAYTVDGRSVSIESSVDLAPRVGELVVADTPRGALLIQVMASRVELREGPEVSVTIDEMAGAAAATRLRFRTCAAHGTVLGSLVDGDFHPVRDTAPFAESLITPATNADVRAYHAWIASTGTGATLDLGTELGDPELRVRVHARGLARHTLFCGQSGSGKTFSLGVLLERVLIDTSLPMLVLDPNSDHVLLASMRSRDEAEQVRARPYADAAWSELRDRHAAAAPGVRVVADAAAANLHIAARDQRALILDLGSFADASARHEAAAMALDLVWESRRDREPMLIVIDEAHDVCPAEPISDAQRHATELAIAIAGEGRKFGRHLLLATQRPQKLHPNVISQCDNLIMLRMNSAADIDELAVSFSHLSPDLMRRGSSFDQGMALVGGPIAPHPLLLRFDGRLTPEGGADIPTSWATSAGG